MLVVAWSLAPPRPLWWGKAGKVVSLIITTVAYSGQSGVWGLKTGDTDSSPGVEGSSFLCHTDRTVFWLASQTTPASGLSHKVYGVLDIEAHDIPGEHVINTPSGKYLAATGAEGKSRHKLTCRQITAPGFAGVREVQCSLQAKFWLLGSRRLRTRLRRK